LDGTEFYLDVNTLPADENNKYAGESWSKDFKYMAFMTQRAGSDWTTVFIREEQSKKVLEDEIKWLKFSGVSWTADSQGFFYSRYDVPKKDDENLAGKNTEKL
jgi:prolyl oligopeptidase